MTKPETFIVPGYTAKVSEQEIRKRMLRIKRAEEIEQDITRVDKQIETENENPYRVEALYYIMNDKEVPSDLKRNIKEYDEKHKITRVEHNTHKLQPVYAPGCNEVTTKEEIRMHLLQVKWAEEIGVDLTAFDEDEDNNPYRLRALRYIFKNQEVPEELKKKVKEYDIKHPKQKSKQHKSTDTKRVDNTKQ